MSVNPLDLQTNFSQIGNIGKQQALLKESQLMRQDQASEIIDKNSLKDADDVPTTKDLSEGSEKIKDRERKEKDSHDESGNNEEYDNEEVTESLIDDSENFKDPNLGRKIDIIS